MQSQNFNMKTKFEDGCGPSKGGAEVGGYKVGNSVTTTVLKLAKTLQVCSRWSLVTFNFLNKVDILCSF